MRQLYDGMMALVTDNATVLEAVKVTNGVKQGCVLAFTPFTLMFSAMLMDAYRDERPGIRIANSTDGQLLNPRITVNWRVNPHPHRQQCRFDPSLSSLRSNVQLTHLAGR
nr:unnamed protein product [Spirometra erinaceieuropaei]